MLWACLLIAPSVLHSCHIVQAMTTASPDVIDQRIVIDANQLSVSLGTVLFGGEERISLFQVRDLALLWWSLPCTSTADLRILLVLCCSCCRRCLLLLLCFSSYLLVQIAATMISTMVHAAPYGSEPTLICWSYSLLGLLVAYWLLRPLVPLVYRCNKLEGDFRLTHSRVREFSECIALYAGELAEKRVSGRAFASLYEVHACLCRGCAVAVVWDCFCYQRQALTHVCVTPLCGLLPPGLQAYILLIRKQLPARGMNQLLTQVGTVVAYGCVAVPLLTVGQLGGRVLTADALFDVVGTAVACISALCYAAGPCSLPSPFLFPLNQLIASCVVAYPLPVTQVSWELSCCTRRRYVLARTATLCLQ